MLCCAVLHCRIHHMNGHLAMPPCSTHTSIVNGHLAMPPCSTHTSIVNGHLAMPPCSTRCRIHHMNGHLAMPPCSTRCRIHHMKGHLAMPPCSTRCRIHHMKGHLAMPPCSTHTSVHTKGTHIQHQSRSSRLHRIATGGRAALPALADLLYTCLLAAASGQRPQQVARLKGLPDLPQGAQPEDDG